MNIIRAQRDESVMIQNKFHITREETLEYLTFPKLSKISGISHLFTTRMGGVSKGIYGSMNLSFSRGDDRSAVLENYHRIAKVLSTDVEHIVCSDQTHTVNIRYVSMEDAGKGVTVSKDYSDVDGLITDVPGLCLATFYADCVPLYFVDPVKKVIGLAHSGWRGTVERMGEHMVNTMKERFGCEPADLIVAIGPSICQSCYEISEEVANRFKEGFWKDKEVLLPGKEPGKYQLDLWKANEEVLISSGILPQNMDVTDVCTCCNSDYLFSHRASHGQRGNLAAFLMLRKS
ncbi:MAG: peptidoglycan editing factor PgeF [Lachnospiraceae bacterium]|nr:peptidoglycan editing factor PgeF [Lachnospiraceae bacterium]